MHFFLLPISTSCATLKLLTFGSKIECGHGGTLKFLLFGDEKGFSRGLEVTEFIDLVGPVCSSTFQTAGGSGG